MVGARKSQTQRRSGAYKRSGQRGGRLGASGGPGKTGAEAKRNPESEIGKTILDSSARTVYVLGYADRVEDLNLEGASGGEDWFDVAPPGWSVAAQEWAEELWTTIVSDNLGSSHGMSLTEGIEECWKNAALADVWLDPKTKEKYSTDPDDSEMQVEFGHYIAMQAMGHGVSWKDDHEDHGLKIPHRESDAWAVVPDADLAPLVSDGDIEAELDAHDNTEPDDPNDDASTHRRGLFVQWTEQDNVDSLRRLVDALRYAASYENEDLQRAYVLAEIFLAGIQREEYLAAHPDEKDLPRKNPLENPIIEYKPRTDEDGYEHKHSTNEVSQSKGWDVLTKHLRAAETHEEGVYIDVRATRGNLKEIDRELYFECTVDIALFISQTRLQWSDSLEERAEHVKDKSYFVYRDQDDRILVPARIERHETNCVWRYADEESDYGLGKCSCSGDLKDEMERTDRLKAVETYLFPGRLLLDARTPTRVDDELMLLRDVFGGPRIRISFDVITPESAETGDVEESGWINEAGIPIEVSDFEADDPKITIVTKAVDLLKYDGANEYSGSRFHPDGWYTQSEGSIDYATGAEERRSFHLVNFTEDEELEIYRFMFPRRRENPMPEACRDCGLSFIEHGTDPRVRWKRTDVIPFDLDPSICSECGVKNSAHRKGVREFEEAMRASEQRELDELKSKLNPRPTREQVRSFRVYLNEKYKNEKHKNRRFEQKTRTYGDYLYAQDRAMFDVELEAALAGDARFSDWIRSNPDGTRLSKYDSGPFGKAFPKWRGRSDGRGVQKGIDWDSQPLGKVSDRELARRLKVSKTVVTEARKARKIPPAPRGTI